MAAYWNIIFGLVAVGAGLSGQLTLFGTNSPWALVALGAAIFGLGVFQLIRRRRQQP